MKTFLKIKSVGSGMTRLLDDFCKAHHLKSPVSREYSFDEYISFEKWLKKLNKVDKQYKKEELGLEIGAMVDTIHIGITAYIVNSCETLSDVLILSSKYNKIWYNYMPKHVEFNNNNCIVSWDKPAYLSAGLFVRETAISETLQVSIFYQRLKKIINDTGFSLNHIELAIPEPDNTEVYEDFFKCPVFFNTSQTKIIFPKYALDMPLRQSDPILCSILKKQAERILSEMPKDDSFIEIVSQSILKAVNNNHAQIEYVAKQMNMSSRVLQKNLKERGMVFKDLLNDIRFNLAKQYLQDRNLSVSDIAFLLAYGEQTSFNRAFKNWTGMSPLQWRNQFGKVRKIELAVQ